MTILKHLPLKLSRHARNTQKCRPTSSLSSPVLRPALLNPTRQDSPNRSPPRRQQPILSPSCLALLPRQHLHRHFGSLHRHGRQYNSSSNPNNITMEVLDGAVQGHLGHLPTFYSNLHRTREKMMKDGVTSKRRLRRLSQTLHPLYSVVLETPKVLAPQRTSGRILRLRSGIEYIEQIHLL